jgi:sirohydrochlorin ferrochelatase
VGAVATDLQASGHQRTWVLPVFTARAYHVRVDVPGALARIADTGLDVIEVEPGLAGNPALVAAALPGWTERPTVLFAAGSSDRDACQALRDHVAAVARGPVATAFLAGGPPLADALQGLAAQPAPLVVPFVIASGILRDRMARESGALGLRLSAGSLCTNPAVADLVAGMLARAVAGERTDLFADLAQAASGR